MRSFAAAMAAAMTLGLATAPAQTGAPPANDGVRLRLPQYELYPIGALAPDRTAWSAPQSSPKALPPLAQPLLSIGPLNIHLGNAGPGFHATQYDFGETRFLGGEVTGTLDGAHGTIRLRWPTNP